MSPSYQDVFQSVNAKWWEGGKVAPIGQVFRARRVDNPIDKITRHRSGRRSRTQTERKRGRYIQSRPANGKVNDIAFDATLRAAAPFQIHRKEQRKKVAFAVQKSDLQKKVRVKRTSNLILFVVDASWSMAVAERMSATKGAILSLLTDAYQRRDRVGLIVFQKDRSTLVLSPTNSIQLAKHALAYIPVGGKTPLSAGLMQSYQTVLREKLIHPDIQPLLIILTDGAGNVSIGDLPPQEEAHFIAEQIADRKIRSIVINMEHISFDQGLAAGLAERLKAPCYSLSEMKADTLYHTVKGELK